MKFIDYSRSLGSMQTQPELSVQNSGEEEGLFARCDTIFRPISNDTAWFPPLYRKTSLLSSPSGDSSDHKKEENSGIPADFIPPKHSFSPQSHVHAVKTSTPIPTTWPDAKPQDILCGRGIPTISHPGNKTFRKLVKEHEISYLCAKKSEKPGIVKQLLAVLWSRGMRFVERKFSKEGVYNWIVIDDQRAYEKICQTLREGAPKLRRRMLATGTGKARQEEQLDFRGTENDSAIQCF